MPSLTDQVRAVLLKTKRPDAEIAREAGIHSVALSRFKTGKRGLSVESLEGLAGALGLRISVTKTAGKSARKSDKGT